MKTRLLISLLVLSVSTQAQALLVINEDSTQMRRIHPRQFIECVIANGVAAPTVIRGRLKLFDTRSFLLETQRKQWTSVQLADLVALRRSNRRAAWPMLFGGETMSSAGVVARRVSPMAVIGAAVAGAGIAGLRGDFSPIRYRWSVYQGWQFQIKTQ